MALLCLLKPAFLPGISSSQTGCKLYTRVLSICGLSEQHTLAPLALARPSPGRGMAEPTASSGREMPTACAGICPPLSWLAGRPYEEGSPEVPSPPPFPQTQLSAVSSWRQMGANARTPAGPTFSAPLSQKNRALHTWLAQASLNRRSAELTAWRWWMRA